MVKTSFTFEVGDVVRCVNNPFNEEGLVVGKDYIVFGAQYDPDGNELYCLGGTAPDLIYALGIRFMKVTKEPPSCVEFMESTMDTALDTFRRKNATYGNSFGKSIEKYGFIAALTRISDKFNRFENLVLGAENQVPDESVCDTLLDMAVYSLMTMYEIKRREGTL